MESAQRLEKPANPNRESVLDGLRGLAAFSVVLFHILHQPNFFDQFGTILQSVILSGASMVQVFFVLSGYFTYKSLKNLHEMPQAQQKWSLLIKTFLVRRFFRIVPLWWSLLLVMYFQKQFDDRTLLANLFFFFGDMNSSGKYFPIFLSWSLQVEVIFYILSALLYPLILKSKLSHLFISWIVLTSLSFVWRSYAYQAFPGTHFPDGFFMAHSMYFVSGIFIAKFGERRAILWRRENGLSFWAFELLVILCFLFMNFFDLNSAKIILAPLLVCVVLSPLSFVGIVLKSKLFQYFGLWSYGIYLLQDISRGHAALWLGTKSSELYIFLSLILTISAAACAHYFIERPFMIYARKKTTRDQSKNM